MTKTVFDRVPYEASKQVLTDEGFLIVSDNRLAKAGVMFYRGAEIGDADEERIFAVYRPPEELFKHECLDSFKSKPFTYTHPGLVDSTNARTVTSGFTKDDIRQSVNYMVGSIIILDADAVSDIRAKRAVELSLGYTATFEKSAGTTPAGEHYDYRMSGITGNHVALVERGRNGRDVCVSDSQPQQRGRIMDMTTLVLDGETLTIPVPVSEMIASLRKQVSDSEEQRTQIVEDREALQAVADKAKEDLDSMQAKVDHLESERMTQDQMDALVAGRVALLDQARKVVADYDGAGKSVEEVHRDVVEKSGVNVADKSPEYVKARFDILVEDAGRDATRKALGSDQHTEKTAETWQEKRQKRMNKEA